MKERLGTLLIGVILFIIGLVLSDNYDSAIASGNTVEATITEVRSYYDGVDDNNYTYYGTYTWEGKTYENVKLKDSVKEYKIGDTYEVVIKPESDGKRMSNVGSIFILLSLWFIIPGFINLFRRKKKENNEETTEKE